MQFRLQLKGASQRTYRMGEATVCGRTIEQALPVMPAYAAIR
jgi:hypothetical protein